MSPLISGLASVASMIFNAASSSASKTAASRRGAAAEVPQASAVVTLSPQAVRVRQFQASEFVHPQWNQSLSGVI